MKCRAMTNDDSIKSNVCDMNSNRIPVLKLTGKCIVLGSWYNIVILKNPMLFVRNKKKENILVSYLYILFFSIDFPFTKNTH